MNFRLNTWVMTSQSKIFFLFLHSFSFFQILLSLFREVLAEAFSFVVLSVICVNDRCLDTFICYWTANSLVTIHGRSGETKCLSANYLLCPPGNMSIILYFLNSFQYESKEQFSCFHDSTLHIALESYVMLFM